MEQTQNFTEGKIFAPLIRFALPVLLALYLQTMYGAVDLLVVGQFGASADVSAFSTGSMVMQTVTVVITSLAMGLTILGGRKIGEDLKGEVGKIIGSGIWLFSGIAICSAGTVFIVAYNLVGSVFRGIGDPTMPLITAAIACALNIIGDLLLVAVFHMGTTGAVIATIFAQAVSVVLSLVIIHRKKHPFTFRAKDIRPNFNHIKQILFLGVPIALQELLVSISFLAITAIVNGLGLTASAGVGLAEKLCGFIDFLKVIF